MTIKEFRAEGVTGAGSADTMFYRSHVTGPDGAHYELLREKHHRQDDVEKAKSYIRHNFDAVSIHIIKETN